MPSMVVMACPTAALTGMTQDRLGTPSRCTVQAPHNATPQPNLVPFIPSRSRNTHSNGMSGGASTLCDFPLIDSESIRVPPLDTHNGEQLTGHLRPAGNAWFRPSSEQQLPDICRANANSGDRLYGPSPGRDRRTSAGT